MSRGLDGERDNGNGSLMRILPLVLTNASDDEIREVSAITHAHMISTNACVELVHIGRKLALDLPVSEAVGKYKILENKHEEEISSSGFVLSTFQAAIWCLITTQTFEECVLKAVNLGEDTDTTAAVAGGLAGIVYGYEKIPNDYIDILRGKDIIDACICW